MSTTTHEGLKAVDEAIAFLSSILSQNFSQRWLNSDMAPVRVFKSMTLGLYRYIMIYRLKVLTKKERQKICVMPMDLQEE
jgi:hypothetical protein